MDESKTGCRCSTWNEQALRTRAWVEANRRLVEKLSDGQLAHLYLPNTGQPATEF
jgi:tricorn protease